MPAYHEKHLPLVLVGQQKETQHCGVGDLVVEGLAVQVQEGRVDPNVIAASGSQTLQLPEDADGVARGLDHICLGQHVLGKGLQAQTPMEPEKSLQELNIGGTGRRH